MAGALTIVIDPMNPGSGGDTRRVIGKLTFSSAYVAGVGDTFDPASMGLQILDGLEIELATNTEQGLTVQPVLVEKLPVLSVLAFAGAPPGHVKAFGVPVPPATNIGNEASFQEVDLADLHLYSARFVAWGS